MRRLLAFYLLLHDLSVVLAQLQVQLHLYTDNYCKTPSTERAVASVPISECIVTPGLGSIKRSSVNCASGTVQLVGYQDTSCGTQQDLVEEVNDCTGAFEGGIAAILLTCNQEDDSGQIDPGTPSTTSTIVVGQVADSAPTAKPSLTSKSPSVTQHRGVTATQTASSSSPSNSLNGGGNGTDDSAGGNSISPSKSSSGLSQSDIISIAVGLGVGIPSILIALVGLRLRLRKNRANREMWPLR